MLKIVHNDIGAFAILINQIDLNAMTDLCDHKSNRNNSQRFFHHHASYMTRFDPCGDLKKIVLSGEFCDHQKSINYHPT